jgi:hypothetical protein
VARSLELVVDTALQGQVQTPPERRSEEDRNVWEGATKPKRAEQKEKSTERVCCLLVLDSVTSTPQWLRQPKPRDVVHDVCVLVREYV